MNLLVSQKLDLAQNHPHDFTIQYPPRREYFQDNFRASTDASVFNGASEVLLYCHVPFCQAKCYYCNFAVEVRKENSLHHRYVSALVSELTQANQLLASAKIGGIDIGGGTPTILATDELMRILEALQPFISRSRSARPLSIETTPAIAAQQPEKMRALAQAGVNRISVGLQSTNAETLAAVNRDEQISVGLTAVQNLMTSGFQRVSVDLIFALPGQTREQWLLDLERVVSLAPDTITTYDCLYRGSGRVLTRHTEEKPSPDAYRELYDLAYDYLLQHGYFAPYGSVNFSRHADETGTSAYFEARLLDGSPYLGLGNYASSLCGQAWWFAPYKVNDWLKRIEAGEHFPVGDSYLLPDAERMAKYLLLSLSFGVIDPQRFQKVFNQELHNCFAAELELAQDQHWLEKSGSLYHIGAGHFGDLPKLRSLFYSARAIDWLKNQK